jgi:hypothetical protein
MFQQVATEQWEIEQMELDDTSLAQALFDAIAASASGFVMVSVNQNNDLVIQTSVDAEAEEN